MPRECSAADDARPWGAVRVLFAASGAVGTAVALANVALLVRAGTITRLRELRLLARMRVLLDAHAPGMLGRLPEILHAPFDLTLAAFDLPHVASVVAFLGLAVVAHLLLAWSVAVLAAPLVLPLGRRHAADAAYPLAVLAATATPLVAHRLSLWTAASAPVLWAASIAIAVATWLVATRVVRSSGAAVTRTCSLVTLAGVALAVIGAGTHATLRAAHSASAGPVPEAGTPNVLLLSIDTLRPDHLGSYGYGRDTSPVLDALAAGGARFTTAVSPTSWTLPAHMTLLTGLPPEVHGVDDDGLRLDASTVTLAAALATRGYATAGFVSGPYLDAGYGFARGFDHYDDYSAVRVSHPAAHQAHTSPALLDAVTAWLQGWSGAAEHRPFFVFVHMWDPHYDFNPPPPFDRMFDPDYDGTTSGLDFETGTAVHPGMPARDLAHVVALYDGEIRYTDGYVGRMLDVLRALDHLDDTVVVVTSDHGEEFFEHGKKGHRNALYDESIRVPLIVRYPPAIPAATVVDRPVRLMDVAPTILALTKTPPPAGFGLPPTLAAHAGRDLTPHMRGETAGGSAPPAFAELRPHALAAVRREDAKLILAPFAATKEELYDLRTDPAEQTNLAPTNVAKRETLKSELTLWRDTAKLAAKDAQAATLGDDHKAALRALGYLE